MGRRSSFYLFLLLLCGFAYVLGFGVEYLLDPLGRAPVLDADENLVWTARITQGNVPSEPLYRALLYPWVLTLLGTEGAVLAQLATTFGVICHCLNAWLVALLGSRLWGVKTAKWTAGLLYLCYPVALYFSVQVLDMTFAMSLFLTGLLVVLQLDSEKSIRRILLWSILSGFLGGLTVLARPNFLPAVLCLPLISMCFGVSNRDKAVFWCSAPVIFFVLCLPLLGQGYFNMSQSGSFRILPWQGAYNLYAANRVGASGQYYTQRIDFETVPEGMNTTRMESELLYRIANNVPEDRQLDIESMNEYWRRQLMQEIKNDPLAWFGLMGRKLVYLFNDWEAYNNLSYPYQKVRFKLLIWNPLGWGVLSLLAFSAVYMMRRRIRRTNAWVLVLVATAYGAGVLLFFVSARFRLPIVPMLCAFCGGLAAIRLNDLKDVSPKEWFGLIVGLLLVGTLVYGSWFEVRDERTFIQDEFLLARASADLGEDEQAIIYASAALARDPKYEAARQIQIVSLFNYWLEVSEDQVLRDKIWVTLRDSVQLLKREDSSTLFIRGVAYWREGQFESAEQCWRSAVNSNVQQGYLSLQALKVVGLDEMGNHTEKEATYLKELLLNE